MTDTIQLKFDFDAEKLFAAIGPVGFKALQDIADSKTKEYDDMTTDIERYIQGIEYVVEATSTEQQMLWERYTEKYGAQWKSRNQGLGVYVGWIQGRPVVITIYQVVVNDVSILFYSDTSQVVDHTMIRRWLDKYFPGVPRTDAMNFSHVANAKKDRM